MRTAWSKKKIHILSPDSRLFALPGCKPVSYCRVGFHYWAEHQQREAQKAMEGSAGWRADTDYKGEEPEPMGLTLR